jgi:hypothetical protein
MVACGGKRFYAVPRLPPSAGRENMVERQGWGEIKDGLGAPIRKLLESRSGKLTLLRMANGEELEVFDVAWGRDAGDFWEHVTVNCSPNVKGRPIHFIMMSDVEAAIDPTTRQVHLKQDSRPGER